MLSRVTYVLGPVPSQYFIHFLRASTLKYRSTSPSSLHTPALSLPLPLPPPPSSAVSLVHFVVRMLRREMKSSKKHTWRLLHAFTRCSRASSSTLWTSTGEDCVCVCVRVCLHVCVPRYVYRDLFLYDTYVHFNLYLLSFMCLCLHPGSSRTWRKVCLYSRRLRLFSSMKMGSNFWCVGCMCSR